MQVDPELREKVEAHAATLPAMPDEPVFPDYEVVDSEELDAGQAAEAREALGGAGSNVVEVPAEGDPLGRTKNIPVDIDALTDEQAVQLAELVRRARLKRCASVGCKRPAEFTVKPEDSEPFGLCRKHGKKLYRRHNAPAMAVPRGRRTHSASGR